MSGNSFPRLRCTSIADTNTLLCANQSRLTGRHIGAVAVDGGGEEAEEAEEEAEVEEVEAEVEAGDTKQRIRQNQESKLAKNISSEVPLELNRILTVSSRE